MLRVYALKNYSIHVHAGTIDFYRYFIHKMTNPAKYAGRKSTLNEHESVLFSVYDCVYVFGISFRDVYARDMFYASEKGV